MNESRHAARAAAREQRKNKSRSDTAYKATSELRAVVGNVTVTKSGVIAWFVQEPVSVSFRPSADVEELIRSTGAGLAELTGRRVFWRVTTRPYAVRQYAEATHADAVRAGEPLPGWVECQRREQERMLGTSLSEKWVYFGVRVSTSRRYREARREVAELTETLTELTDRVAAYGLDARPARPVDMEWLLRRSIGLGLPAPAVDSAVLEDYDEDDLPELWEHARWSCEPWGRSVKVVGKGPSGVDVTRHVVVLTMGRVGDMHIPGESGGWMQRTDRLTFPVEWMGTTDVVPNDKSITRLRHQMDLILDQWKHYKEDHQIEPPESLKRQHAMALQSEDEVAQGLGGMATRTEGWYRLAVWGATEADALANVRAVQKLYGRSVAWVHSFDQYRLAREFIAGEPLANTAHRRHMSVLALAAALPAATAEIGDRLGAVLGWTGGSSRRAVIWHPWRDMEVWERSGLMLCAGGLGSGKTFAAGSIVYRTAMSGVPWHIFDPTGRLRALCDLPEFAGRAKFVDLLAGRSGELNPYRVVAEPRREHFARAEEWQAKQSEAQAQRKALCKDVLRLFLPKEIRSQARAASVLTRAVNRVPGSYTSSPSDVLGQLVQIADGQIEGDLTAEHRVIARDIFTELDNLARTPNGKLIFATGYTNDYAAVNGPVNADGTPVEKAEPVITVYSMHGMSIPTEKTLASGDESAEVRMSLVLLNLAAWLVQRSIYMGDKDRRKGLLIDEGHLLAALDAGRTLIAKSSVDSRKHNARVILSSQNVSHFDQADIGNLVGAALIGRTEDESAARAALAVLKIRPEQAYIDTLANLSRQRRRDNDDDQREEPDRPREKTRRKKYREFVFSDGRGAVERIVFDMHAHPHVVAALNTTSDPARAKEEAAA